MDKSPRPRPDVESALQSVARLRSPLAAEVLRLAQCVRGHSVFCGLGSVADVRVFMEYHVWAVWDFMSLLKTLQASVAPSKSPWVPPADAVAARMVNEIVLVEEADECQMGGYSSHFEIYVSAMDAAGANTAAIRAVSREIGEGVPWREALHQRCPFPVAREFVEATLSLTGASLPEQVAAFTLGREEIIPGMFHAAVERLDRSDREGADSPPPQRLYRGLTTVVSCSLCSLCSSPRA